MTTLVKEKFTKHIPTLEKELGLGNVMAVPRLVKVVISIGTGSLRDKKKNELIADRLAKIIGQKTANRAAKKSIATFKSRTGDIIGQVATLRGERMYGFLDKLINVAIPRMRDFRGIDPKSIDEMGNITIGIKEHTVFPETADEDIKDVFGFAVTIATTAKNKKEARALFDAIGIPFKKSN